MTLIRIFNRFAANVQLMYKPGSWLALKKCVHNHYRQVALQVKMQASGTMAANQLTDLDFYVQLLHLTFTSQPIPHFLEHPQLNNIVQSFTTHSGYQPHPEIFTSPLFTQAALQNSKSFELEPPGMSWNELERAETTYSKLKRD